MGAKTNRRCTAALWLNATAWPQCWTKISVVQFGFLVAILLVPGTVAAQPVEEDRDERSIERTNILIQKPPRVDADIANEIIGLAAEKARRNQRLLVVEFDKDIEGAQEHVRDALRNYHQRRATAYALAEGVEIVGAGSAAAAKTATEATTIVNPVFSAFASGAAERTVDNVFVKLKNDIKSAARADIAAALQGFQDTQRETLRRAVNEGDRAKIFGAMAQGRSLDETLTWIKRNYPELETEIDDIYQAQIVDLHTLSTTELLTALPRLAEGVDELRTDLRRNAGTLERFRKEVRQGVDRITKSMDGLRREMGKVRNDIKELKDLTQKSERRLATVEAYMFRSMSPREQAQALRSGAMPQLSSEERRNAIEKAERIAGIQDFASNVAAGYSILSAVFPDVRNNPEIQKAVQVTSIVSGALVAHFSGAGPLATLNALSGLAALGGSNTPPNDPRIDQILEYQRQILAEVRQIRLEVQALRRELAEGFARQQWVLGHTYLASTAAAAVPLIPCETAATIRGLTGPDDRRATLATILDFSSFDPTPQNRRAVTEKVLEISSGADGSYALENIVDCIRGLTWSFNSVRSDENSHYAFPTKDLAQNNIPLGMFIEARHNGLLEFATQLAVTAQVSPPAASAAFKILFEGISPVGTVFDLDERLQYLDKLKAADACADEIKRTARGSRRTALTIICGRESNQANGLLQRFLYSARLVKGIEQARETQLQMSFIRHDRRRNIYTFKTIADFNEAPNAHARDMMLSALRALDVAVAQRAATEGGVFAARIYEYLKPSPGRSGLDFHVEDLPKDATPEQAQRRHAALQIKWCSFEAMRRQPSLAENVLRIALTKQKGLQDEFALGFTYSIETAMGRAANGTTDLKLLEKSYWPLRHYFGTDWSFEERDGWIHVALMWPSSLEEVQCNIKGLRGDIPGYAQVDLDKKQISVPLPYPAAVRLGAFAQSPEIVELLETRAQVTQWLIETDFFTSAEPAALSAMTKAAVISSARQQGKQ